MTAPRILTVTLRADEFEVLSRPIRARRDGQMQRVLRRIVGRMNVADRTIPVYPQDILAAREYAGDAYGGGGYQVRFSAIVAAYDRALKAEG